MKSLLAIIKYGLAGLGLLVAIVTAAAFYGASTPNADLERQQKQAAKRADAERQQAEQNKAAREAGGKLAESVLAVDKARQKRKEIYDAGFDLGKLRAEQKKPLPDMSSMNSLAKEIIESHGYTSERDELETQFRAGYSRGFLAGK